MLSDRAGWRPSLHKDEQNDLAVSKVLGRASSVDRISGDSSESRSGPKGHGNREARLGWSASVSDGVISALREIDGRSVQTSAAISPGSSGGVLLNSRGEVIGVTSFKLTGGENLNFAIPSRFIKPLLIAGKVLAFAPKQEQSAPIATQEQAPPSPPLQVEQPEIPVVFQEIGFGSMTEARWQFGWRANIFTSKANRPRLPMDIGWT